MLSNGTVITYYAGPGPIEGESRQAILTPLFEQ